MNFHLSRNIRGILSKWQTDVYISDGRERVEFGGKYANEAIWGDFVIGIGA